MLKKNKIKRKIIIIITSIEECYKRVVNRWKEISKNYNEEELTRYQNRKLGMYEWYKSINKFDRFSTSTVFCIKKSN